jgi:hypothetical protein
MVLECMKNVFKTAGAKRVLHILKMSFLAKRVEL